MAIVVVPCGVTLGEVCCVLAMMFEVVMVKESEGSGGCSAGGPLSQCPLTAAAIPLQHKICVVAWNLENFVRHHCSFLHLFRPPFTPPLLPPLDLLHYLSAFSSYPLSSLSSFLSFPSGFGEGDRATRDEREEREAYRTRGGPDYEKKGDTGAGADFRPEFRGGFGRGRGFGAPGGGRFGQ